MPVSPDYSADLAKGLLGVYVAAEERILRLIGVRLARGLAAPAWREAALKELQGLRIETEKIVRLVDEKGTKALTGAVWTAYNRGVALAGVDLTAAGSAAGSFGSVNTRGLTALVDTAKQTLGPSLLRIQSGAARMYSDVVADTAALELAGTMTRREAAAHSLRTWADRGVPGFVDKAGRTWEMGAYAEMTARTASGQAMIAGHVDRLREVGRDLVMVSDAPEECQLCRAWEGKVLSLSGESAAGPHDAPDGSRYTVAGRLQQAIAAGLFHPNCRHRLVLFLPGVTERLQDTADPEGDALRQRQRAYERDIRKRKRRIAALGPVDAAAARLERGKLRGKQAEFKAWREKHGRKDLAYRTSITAPEAPDAPDAPVFPGGLPTPPPPAAPKARAPRKRPAAPAAPPPPPPPSILREAVEASAVHDTDLRTAIQDAAGVDLGGGVRGELVGMVARPSDGTLIAKLNFVDADGKKVGSAQRRFFIDADGKLGVEHLLLMLNNRVQGKGIGSRFNRQMEQLYRDNGVDYIDLNANIDVGGYAWARAGYDWAPSATVDQVQTILEDVNRVLRVDGPEKDQVLRWMDTVRDNPDRSAWPTPFEISQVGWKEGAKFWAGKSGLLGQSWDGRKYLRQP